MELHFGDWVLVDGEREAFVYRPDHFGNGDFAFVMFLSMGIHNAYVSKSRLTKLDPALYPYLESELERLKLRRS